MDTEYIKSLLAFSGLADRVKSAFVTEYLVACAYEDILPSILAILDRDNVPGLSIVVLNPAMPYAHTVRFPGLAEETAVFAKTVMFHRNLGDVTTWKKFDGFALGKAKVCWVFGEDSDKIQRTRNRKSDCSYTGGISFRGVVVAVSGHPDGNVDKEIAYALAQKIDKLVYEEYASREQPAFFE